tara:strand:- start:264 stop:800 length:537 start_codon:yes stop_codon:yes gene_type:complete
MPNTTTNYALYKPLVNDATDEDLWGGYLNDSMDLIDTQMKVNADATTLAVVGALVYPVGSYYINETVSTNPGTLLGFGTWVAVEDTFLVGLGSTYTTTGGAATDSISVATANLPATMTLTDTACGDVDNNVTGGSFLAGVATASDTRSVTVSTGGSGSAISVDTVPPYQAAYIWKRTV